MSGNTVIVNAQKLLDLQREYPEILNNNVLPSSAYALVDKMNMRNAVKTKCIANT